MCRLTAQELRAGPGHTLFVLAGAGGETDELRLLADALSGDPRVVAIAVAADPGAAETVETIAVDAVSLIRAVQPDGPYRLLGYSFGGLLALECARLMLEADEDVGFVGIVDSCFDHRHWPTPLFLAATTRRTGRHARRVLGLPPTQAVREVAGRSVRLARRLWGRVIRADTSAGQLRDLSVQGANLAVMSRSRPRVLDHPVTLFAATESDFGCDLSDMWRPWLPRLEVRRVWGAHLELTQSAPGAARLAGAVSRALEAPSPGPTVLVASTFRWPGAARLAVDLHEVGCTVEGVAPRGSALHAVTAVRRSHRLGLAAPVRSLRRAIEASEADLVVAFDDRTRHALIRLHALSDPRTVTGARMRDLLELSLGAPEWFTHASSRADLMAIAREAGVTCPPTAPVGSAEDVARWFAQHPGPAVLKTDGSWGGRGVTIVSTEAEAQRAWRTMGRRTAVTRALKRLFVERDPWALRAWVTRARPTLSIQAYVAGRPATASIACVHGTPLGAVQAEVLESDGPTGPSTVLRLIEHPDISFAVKTVTHGLGLSGLCGLDFVLDGDGRAHLLELNPRATPTSHLVTADGIDLLTALRTALGHPHPPRRPATSPSGLVALFPQELRRDPSSPNLAFAHHDLPTHAPDLVARLLPRPASGAALGRRRR